MEQINELVGLAQQLDSVMDDAGMVISFSIDSTGGVRFLVHTPYLLEKFDDVEVIKKRDKQFPFTLEAEIEGVGFRAFVGMDELELLRGKVPDEWIDEVTQEQVAHKIRFDNQNNTLPKHEKSPIALPCE